jgi:Ribbon-helix-helix protein, copG family
VREKIPQEGRAVGLITRGAAAVHSPYCRAASLTLSIFMATRNKALAKPAKKRTPGRPRKPDAATTTVAVALSKDLVDKLDAWRKREGVKTRSAAIRHCVEEIVLMGKR